MYTRNYEKSRRYSPPPGYAGNTFAESSEVKHHPPSDEVPRARAEEPKRPEEKPAIAEQTDVCDTTSEQLPEKHDVSPLEELLKNLRGKFGSEELIILTVMLLIAQDGIGVEVLILALILIAG